MARAETEAMWFGTNADGSELWNGRIDELAFFDKSLSEAEVNRLYQAASEEVSRTQDDYLPMNTQRH